MSNTPNIHKDYMPTTDDKPINVNSEEDNIIPAEMDFPDEDEQEAQKELPLF